MPTEAHQFISLALEGLFTALASVLWFSFRDVKKKGETNADVIASHKLHVAENYVTKRDLKDSIDALFEKLDRIENKLDHKQDKPT